MVKGLSVLMKSGSRVWAIGLCCSAVLVFLLTFVGPKGASTELRTLPARSVEAGLSEARPEDLHPRGGWLSASHSSQLLLQHEAPPRKKLLAVVGVQVRTVPGQILLRNFCWQQPSLETHAGHCPDLSPTYADGLHNKSWRR